MSLVNQLRKSRESVIDVCGHRLAIRRPTDLQATGMRYDSLRKAVEGVAPYVIGWEDMTELKLGIPGGTGAEVPFDSELFLEWISDKPEMWAPLSEGVLKAFTNHRDKEEAIVKN